MAPYKRVAYYQPGAQLVIRASGEVLEHLEALRQISGSEDLEDLIIRAVYVFREILGDQALGATVFSDNPQGRIDLVHLVKDQDAALRFVEHAKLFSFGKDWHLFFAPSERGQQ